MNEPSNTRFCSCPARAKTLIARAPLSNHQAGFHFETDSRLLSLVLALTNAFCTFSVRTLGIEYTQFPKLTTDHKAVHPLNHPQVAIAVSGRDFGLIRAHLPDEYQRLILGAAVFARMGPDQKAQLIEDLKAVGLVVFRPWFLSLSAFRFPASSLAIVCASGWHVRRWCERLRCFESCACRHFVV